MFFWLKVGLIVAAIAAVAFAKHSYDVGKEAIGAARVQAKWDADKAVRIRAFSDMTTRWTSEQLRADGLQKEKDDARNIATNKAHARAAAIPAADAGMHFPGSAARVLNDAIADSTPAAGTAGQPPAGAAAPAADSTVAALTEWGLTCIDLYSQARDSLIGWIDYYTRLRSAQPKEVTP